MKNIYDISGTIHDISTKNIHLSSFKDNFYVYQILEKIHFIEATKNYTIDAINMRNDMIMKNYYIRNTSYSTNYNFDNITSTNVLLRIKIQKSFTKWAFVNQYSIDKFGCNIIIEDYNFFVVDGIKVVSIKTKKGICDTKMFDIIAFDDMKNAMDYVSSKRETQTGGTRDKYKENTLNCINIPDKYTNEYLIKQTNGVYNKIERYHSFEVPISYIPKSKTYQEKIYKLSMYEDLYFINIPEAKYFINPTDKQPEHIEPKYYTNEILFKSRTITDVKSDIQQKSKQKLKQKLQIPPKFTHIQTHIEQPLRTQEHATIAAGGKLIKIKK
jgi:hypothetical protein